MHGSVGVYMRIGQWECARLWVSGSGHMCGSVGVHECVGQRECVRISNIEKKLFMQF